MAIPVWLKEKTRLPVVIRQGIGPGLRAPLVFTDHHESHAASAFFPSPFDEAAILTLDGVGEWSTTALGVGRGNQIELIAHIQFPHSLGLLYSAFTYYCGFKVNSGEYKLMGLAPYGRPIYKDLITRHLIKIRRRRQLLAEHGLLQLLPGADDDEPRVRRPVRRPAAATRKRTSNSGTWIWRRASRRSPKTPCSRSAASCFARPA